MKIKYLFLSLLAACSSIKVAADEGMWLPTLLEGAVLEKMLTLGGQLSAEDIYSVNQACLKDAVVLFGGGCTGAIVSNKGLLFTNYHCAQSRIQSHSSVENDYITNGFWAANPTEELTNQGLTASRLIYMADVTESVLAGVTAATTEQERTRLVRINSDTVIAKHTKGTHYTGSVEPLYYGNQYFLYVMETFHDVRLVGAPMAAIGKFGGDTDNWMWPRHTGDFAMFRIYADSNNRPAPYHPSNVPYKPKKHLQISLSGVKEGDFTVVMGFPGSTAEYLPSYAIETLQSEIHPAIISARAKKLGIINAAMQHNNAIRIQYFARQMRIANYWKKLLGQQKGFAQNNTISRKQSYEQRFSEWAKAHPVKQKEYGTVLETYQALYKEQLPHSLWMEAYYENIYNNDLMAYAMRFRELIHCSADNQRQMDQIKTTLIKHTRAHFKTLYKPVTDSTFTILMDNFCTSIDTSMYPDALRQHFLDPKASFLALSAASILNDEHKTISFIREYQIKKRKILMKDPLFRLAFSFADKYYELHAIHQRCEEQLDSLHRLYMRAQLEMEPERTFYPDANASFRIAFGQVSGYSGDDAVTYHYQTTLAGILMKEDPTSVDYRVPEKLKTLFKNRQYGRYGENDIMPVCFLATNHTSGGNSGSPVLNAKGQLIGLNFDRNWEGTVSDYLYDPGKCRNISLDIRYCLFILENFSPGTYVLSEMDFSK